MRNPFEPGDLGGLGLDNSSGIWTPGLVIGVVFAGLLTYYAVNPDPEMIEEAKRARRKRGLSGWGDDHGHGVTYRPVVGSKVTTDSRLAKGWGWSTLLSSSWDEAPFKLSGGSPVPAQAVKVRVTGKTRRDAPRLTGVPVVRVQVTFVGDGEPDQVVGGWARVDSLKEILP